MLWANRWHAWLPLSQSDWFPYRLCFSSTAKAAKWLRDVTYTHRWLIINSYCIHNNNDDDDVRTMRKMRNVILIVQENFYLSSVLHRHMGQFFNRGWGWCELSGDRSLVRRFTGPKVHWSEGALVRRFTGPHFWMFVQFQPKMAPIFHIIRIGVADS